ncbi:MAG: acetate--CoA ligase family protein [Ignavibacteriae bacterium]|nr:acetate--CoA ligase family protein [Ignavibacteriota bacterium]
MAHNFDGFFYPKSIAIVGASSKEKTLGRELMKNLLNFGYNGKIYPINPKADMILDVKAYPAVTAIEDSIDLAIIMVSKQFIISSIDDCAEKNIRNIIVITAGFKEVGEEGIEMEKLLMKKISDYGMRMVGPNCMGIINTKEGVMMNGTFVQGEPNPGGIGFVSQSGALGAAVLKILKLKDVGFAQFLSIGNKADIDETGMLEYWRDNDDVKVITLYLESFGDARKFMETAKTVTKKKPVISIKAARTAAGMKAASSHTGALASADTVVDAIFEQSGVIRVASVDELFDLAKSFDRTILPEGKRVGILTNAGGPAILTVDEAQNSGLNVPVLSEATQNKLKEICVPEAAFSNPVDVLPPATAEIYGKATEIMMSDENIDAGIIILGPPLMHDTLEIGKHICEAVMKSGKCSTVVLMSQDDIIPKLAEAVPGHPPIFNNCEAAAKAIGQMYKYKLYKEKAEGKYIKYTGKKKIVNDILKKYKGGETYIAFDDVVEILKAYELPIVESFFAVNVQQSVDIADKIGYPVVIKVAGKKLVHKSDVGGVIVNIKNLEELIQAENKIIAGLKEKGIDNQLEGFTIQPFIKGGTETILGVMKDAKAGHLVAFGMGGVMVEVMKDVKFKLLPVNDMEAEELIKSVNAYRILKGVRGNPPVDIEFVKGNILKLSQLISDFPEIEELDLNPFVFSHQADRSKILDARIKIKL